MQVYRWAIATSLAAALATARVGAAHAADVDDLPGKAGDPSSPGAPAAPAEPASPRLPARGAAADLPVDPAYQTTVTTTTPLHGSSLPWDRVPANVQTARGSEITRNREPSLSDFLNTSLGSVHVNDAQANPLQPDLQFRGFTASPLLGVAQGLSIYVDGMRVNEPFGDTVNWDLIPAGAIATLNLIPGSNPVFGLNTLGGALSIETKTGFSAPGAALHLSGGSFGRRRMGFELGDSSGRWGYFIVGSLFQEDGWRDFAPSETKNVFADVMYAGARTKANLSLMAADTSLNGNAAVPLQLLAERRAAAFTYPDNTQNRLLATILRAERPLGATVQLSGLAFYRQGHTTTRNGDQAEFRSCQDPSGADVVCADSDTGTPAPIQDQNGQTVPVDAVHPYNAAQNATDTRQHSGGATVQLSVDHPLGRRENHLTAGVSGQLARINFSSQSLLARRTADRGTLPTDIIVQDSLVAVDSTVRNLGLYLTDTFEVLPHLYVTAAGRYNLATLKLEDQLGAELNGDHQFQRFNPSIGVSYQPWLAFGGFASYAESARTPTALELSCASPDAPCRLPNAFIADPPLQQVVARTVEVGLRGRVDRPRTHVDYSAGVFRTASANDIIFISDGPLTNQGYFSNVGDTRRQGVELGLRGDHRVAGAGASVRLEWSLHYTWMDASFQTAFLANSPNHPQASMSEIAVSPGARLPNMPRHIGKGSLAVVLGQRLRVGADVIGNGDLVYRGDEANLLDKVPGYVVAHAQASYDLIADTGLPVSVFAKLSNLTNNNYSTFGVLGSPTQVLGPAYNDPRFQTPGAPRSFWVGADVRY